MERGSLVVIGWLVKTLQMVTGKPVSSEIWGRVGDDNRLTLVTI
jgi:hypothetical protein